MNDLDLDNKYDIIFEEWYDEHIEDLLIEFAETGSDREMDFDIELELDKRFELYLNSCKNDKI